MREPLEVVVTLCHVNPTTREELWERLSPQARSQVLPRINEVHLVSMSKTRDYARDMNTRLGRAIRSAGRVRAAS
jgi:hypothetical protein